jgi:hypothetical protein
MHLKTSAVSLKHVGLAYLLARYLWRACVCEWGVQSNGIVFWKLDFSLDAIAFHTNVRFGTANRRETKALRRVYTAVYGAWGGAAITAGAACLPTRPVSEVQTAQGLLSREQVSKGGTPRAR